MEALLTLGKRFHHSPRVDRKIIEAVWSICMFGRAWGLHPDGMLQRNKLITAADTDPLETWVDTIEQTALELLSGIPPHRVVVGYAEYILSVGWWEQ